MYNMHKVFFSTVAFCPAKDTVPNDCISFKRLISSIDFTIFLSRYTSFTTQSVYQWEIFC